jgi:hypothetical protein
MNDLSFEEYTKIKLEDELYGLTAKSKSMKDYEEKEIQFIRDMFVETNGHEPTEQEIEEQKIELMKLKYLVDTWIDEYFEKVEKEHEAEKEKARESIDSRA